jgi:hypothetical protein
MAIIFFYFALFLGVHFLSRRFVRRGAARLMQLVACFILLFGFFGFRNITVLNDTPHYYGAYYQLTHLRNYVESSIFTYRILLSFEYGYQVLQHALIKYVSKEPFTIIIVSSLIISWGNIKFVSRQTRRIALALLMMLLSGVLFDQYCLIRQSFALMLFYAALPYLKQERWKPYVALVGCAAFFHLSALVLLILPILQRIRICKRNVAIIFGIALLISVTVYEIFNLAGLGETKYFLMNIKRDTFPIGAVLDGSWMLLLLLTCLWLYKKMGMTSYDKTTFWIGVSGLCVCIITPSFLSFFRLNIFVWPIIYLTFFRFVDADDPMTEYGAQRQCQPLRRQLMTTALALLAVRMAMILIFRNEWYHLIPYSFYDFSDRFHGFNMYWENNV